MQILEAIQQVRDIFALAGLQANFPQPQGCHLNTDFDTGKTVLTIGRLEATKIDGFFPDPPLKLFADRGFRVINYTPMSVLDGLGCIDLQIEFPPPQPVHSADVAALIAAWNNVKIGDTVVLPSGTAIKIISFKMKNDAPRETLEGRAKKLCVSCASPETRVIVTCGGCGRCDHAPARSCTMAFNHASAAGGCGRRGAAEGGVAAAGSNGQATLTAGGGRGGAVGAPAPTEPLSLHQRAMNFFATDVREKKK